MIKLENKQQEEAAAKGGGHSITMIKNKKGFTLVEVIVVLVILAILAAILVPSFIAYIQKAEKRTVVIEARNVLLAAKAAVVEMYALDKEDLQSGVTFINKDGVAAGRVTNNMLKRIQDVNGDISRDQGQGSTSDKAVAKAVLEYLSSVNKNTAEYKLHSGYNPQGVKIDEYIRRTNNKPQPGIIISYLSTGEIDFVEFGLERYMAHINGKTGEITLYDGKNGDKYTEFPK